MGRPAKSYLTLVDEGKSHRTKEELEQRKKAEEALATGIKFKEKLAVKNDPVAHKEFQRVKKLFEILSKNDGLHENIINRYCQIYSECIDFEEKRETFYKSINEMEKVWAVEQDLPKGERSMTALDYLKLRSSLQGQVVSLDKQIMQKRKMMLDIEKESLMTIASALRSIPKRPEEEDDPNAGMFGD